MTNEWGRAVQENKTNILDAWMSRSLLLFSGKMAAASPVAEALHQALGMVLDNCEKNSELLTGGLVQLSRILAVQDMPPSQAMSLFFELKKIILEFSLKGSQKHSLKQLDLDALQSRLEELTLQSFDSYMMQREMICQLKLDESKRMLFMQLRRSEV